LDALLDFFDDAGVELFRRDSWMKTCWLKKRSRKLSWIVRSRSEFEAFEGLAQRGELFPERIQQAFEVPLPWAAT